MILSIGLLWKNQEFESMTAASAIRYRIDDGERGKRYEVSVHRIEYEVARRVRSREQRRRTYGKRRAVEGGS